MPIFDGASTWKYKSRHVQARTSSGQDFDGGNFIRGASILLLAGPRKYAESELVVAASNASALTPIGLLQTGSISQQKQLEEIFEIGSEKRYFVPGRTYYQLQAQRIMVQGASLLRVMRNRFTDEIEWESQHGVTIPDSELAARPGHNDYFMNLSSAYFNKPGGILVIDNNADDQIVGGSYLEDCYIQTYNRQIAAQQTVVAEQCVIRFDGLVPVERDDIQTLLGRTGNPDAVATP